MQAGSAQQAEAAGQQDDKPSVQLNQKDEVTILRCYLAESGQFQQILDQYNHLCHRLVSAFHQYMQD